MPFLDPNGPWLTVLIFAVLFLVIFRRPLAWLGKLLVRSALGLGFLALWSYSGLAAGEMLLRSCVCLGNLFKIMRCSGYCLQPDGIS